MAHFVTVEDTNRELIDLEVYCTDSCAQWSNWYDGWFGAQEVEFDTTCKRCGTTVHGSSGPGDL